MTYHADQRWVASTSRTVTLAVLERRENPAFRERFEAKIDILDPEDCHIWIGALSSEGYGTFRVGRHNVRAHRVAYLLRWGDILGDYFLDHLWPLCKGRWCVNTDHLEPVDNAENSRRGVGIGKLNQRALRSELLIDRRQTRERETISWLQPAH